MDFNQLPTREAVLKKLFISWKPDVLLQTVPVTQAIGRITAEPVYAKYSLPVFRSSMADGIAVDAARFEHGRPDMTCWKEGSDYVRADTGDDFDDRFNAVIAIENVAFLDEGGIVLSPNIETVNSGDKIRTAGSDIRQGDCLIDAHMQIREIDLSMLVMGGVEEVRVIRQPTIVFIPTGSELIEPGVVPQRGKNIDTNSTLAKHTLRNMGAAPICLPIIRDEPEKLELALDEALRQADIVIINGGSSKGAEDYNARLLKSRGDVLCHGVAAAPGRPMCIAVINNKPVINLPGPLIAAFYGMDWCIRAAINHYLGIPMPVRQTVTAVLTDDMKAPKPMAFLCKVQLKKNAQGGYEAAPQTFQNSRSLCIISNGMFISPVGEDFYPKGTVIKVELLRGIEYL